MKREASVVFERTEIFRFVALLKSHGKDQQLGTGFFVIKGNSKPYLVTASHHARTCDGKTSVVLSDDDGNATSLAITELNAKVAWIHHDKADVAALPIEMNRGLASLMSNRFFPFSQIHSALSPVDRDTTLTTFGFPNGLGVQEGGFCPLTFRSHASSGYVTLKRRDTNEDASFFLLENPSVEGYSGGPCLDLGYEVIGGVMIETGSGTILHGLAHGTIADETGGKLGAVTPAHFLAGLLQ